MTVTIHLPPDQEEKLRARARANGQDVTAYVQLLVEKDLQGPPTVAEALAPFREQVKDSGLTDEELDSFFQEVREEVWQEKQAKSGKIP